VLDNKGTRETPCETDRCIQGFPLGPQIVPWVKRGGGMIGGHARTNTGEGGKGEKGRVFISPQGVRRRFFVSRGGKLVGE